MPIIVKGFPVATLQSIVPVGKTVPPPVPFQLSCDPGKTTRPVAMFPVPGDTPTPPVGIVERPILLFSARNDSQFNVSYIIPAPPRITFLLFPEMSHAKPA